MLPWILGTLLVLAPGWVHAQLSFNEALTLATHDAPRLNADAARVAALRAEAIPSDALPDPKLVVGVENLPITGQDSFSFTRDFMTMEKIGVQQAWTNRAKREARRRGANAKVDTATVAASVTRLNLRREAALAWLAVYFAERKLAALTAAVDENARLLKTVAGRYAAGTLNPVAALAPQAAALDLDEQRETLEAASAQARLELQRLVGAAADLPLGSQVPTFPLEPAHLRAHLEKHPELLEFAARLDVARATVAVAEADKRPDWEIEVAYAHRGPDFGDMVSAEVSIDLPLFQTQRQDPIVAARLHDLAMLEAERAQMLRDHQAELERGLNEHRRLTQRLTRYQKQRLPLAERAAALAEAAYAARDIELDEVFAARQALIATRLAEIDATAEVVTSAARLYYTYEGGEHDARE
jgi:outer membrane protein, heavy metal efflux system